jgi:hypothetical protein
MVIFIIVGLFVAFFYKIFFLKQVFFLGDNLLVIAPHKEFLLNSLKNGVLPLWNPNMWAGFPEYADSTLGLFNPFNLIYLLAPNLGGITLSALASYFIAFLGTYLFFKSEGLKKFPALIGAVIFAFSGSMINISLDIIRLNVICFLPWILLALKNKNFFLTTLFLSLSILAGQFQHFYMPQFFIIGYLIFFSHKNEVLKNLIFYALSFGFSLGITLFTLLPQINFIQHTTRNQAGLTYNTIWSLHPASVIRFFFADFWGRRNEGSFWGPNVTYSFGYIGFFPLIFILSKLKKNNKKTVFLLGLALFSLLISFGKYNPLYNLFLLIPGMSLFRNPSSWLIIYSFTMAVLTAMLANKKDFAKNKIFKKICLISGLILTVLGIFLFITYKFYPALPHTILVKTAGLMGKSLSSFHTQNIDLAISFLLLRNFIVLGLLSLILYKFFRLRVFLFVVFLDLLLLGTGDLFLGSKNILGYYQDINKSPHVQYLKQNIKTSRFVSTSEFTPLKGISTYHDNYYRRPPFFPKDFWILSPEEFVEFTAFYHELSLLPPNFNLHYHLSSINGYSSFVLKEYTDYFKQDSDNLSKLALVIKEVNALNPPPFDPTTVNFDFISLDDPRLTSLSVKFILSDQKLQLDKFKELQFENGFFIYENQAGVKRAQIIDENKNIVSQPEVSDLDANSVLVNLKGVIKNGQILILRDVFYPGWKAYDNLGNELIVNKYEVFRSVNLKDNTKSVKFIFQPDDFYLSLKISISFLVFFLIFSYFKLDKKLLKTKIK